MNNNQDFEEFVKRQQKLVHEPQINWANERAEWLAKLDQLYKKVESLLSKYLSAGEIKLEYKAVQLQEENIGPYDAREVILHIGRQQVLLVPVGTMVLGAKGRVDVIGPAGRAQVLLVERPPSPNPPPDDANLEWKIVTRPPERRFLELTQQSLFQLIMEVANG